MFIYQGSIITNFLSQNGQQYKIPVYQRNYEWSWEQCDKLFEDIVRAAKRNQLHFCGSIVFQPIAPMKGINNNIVIDGQQRLTTIYILIKALLDQAENDAERMMPKQALFNTDQFHQYQLDQTTKMKLKPAKDNNDQLLHLIYDKHDQIDKTCEIYRNYLHFCDLIKEEKTNGITVADIYRGIGLLTVAVIQLDGNDKAQEIFERINSTGIPLNLADKIRNYVLMTDSNQDRLYEEYWLKTEQLLTKEQLAGFFMDYLNMKLDGFTKESAAYDDFKMIYSQGGYTNESMLVEILHYAKQYRIFFHGDTKLSKDINNALTGLRRLNQTTVYLFLFQIFDDYEDGTIDQIELARILQLLLNYSIRRLICEVGSNSLRGLYKTLYGRVFNRPENKDHYYDSIVSFLLQLTSKDAIPKDAEFMTALKRSDLYRKNALCKYLLEAIENQGKEQVKTDDLSIEHIMPQNKHLSTSWQIMLGDDWENVHERYLHTLGNLTLTGYNSELGDKPFSEKKELLAESVTHITVLYSDVKDKDIWNSDTIEARAQRLASVIMTLFPILQPETKVDFTDPRYQEYTVSDPGNATYKHVNYYVLKGERVNVDSFALMVRSVATKLFDNDSSIIEKMARKSEAFPTWLNPVFSYDENAIKGAVKLKKDSDIYISTGYSANDCICFIREMLKKYDLNPEEDFVYSARPSNAVASNVNRVEAAKVWCEGKATSGQIVFDRKNSQDRYIRFTTPLLNGIVPENATKLSPWETTNYYFYEITNYKGELFIQLYFYCWGISDEMKAAYVKLSELLNKGELTKGYELYFKSTAFQNSDDDTEAIIENQLDKLLAEVQEFEADVMVKWQD
jgi:uncharacterized protein with ParB-like and HNH nuclease domain